ncbi:penicillin-binding transpeptidase domain-containing protein, partial [Streptococcus pyogenes]
EVLRDAASHGWLDVGEIIAVSSNIGAAKIAERVGAEQVHASLSRFGIGRAPRNANAEPGQLPPPSASALAAAQLATG